MTKYCKNEACLKYGEPVSDDLNFCQYCDEPLSGQYHESPDYEDQNPVYNEPNADYSVKVNDSHDNIVNNSYSNDVVNKYTNVYVGKSRDEQTLPQRLAEYRKFCLSKMESGIVSVKLRQELDTCALELNLSEEQKLDIEMSVRKLKEREESIKLTKADLLNLENAKNKICQNTASLKSLKENLASFAKCKSDEAQFYYYMVSALANPAEAINDYGNEDVDYYWSTFWTSIAYRKQGNKTLANQTLRKLQNWKEFPTDNMNIAYCMLSLMDKEYNDAQNFISHTNIDCISSELTPLKDAIEYLIRYKANARLSNSSQCNFYLQNVFGIIGSSDIKTNIVPQPVNENVSHKFTAPPPPHKATQRDVESVHIAINDIENPSTVKTADRQQGRKVLEREKKDSLSDSIKKNSGWIALAVCVAGVAVFFLLPDGKPTGTEENNVPATVTVNGNTTPGNVANRSYSVNKVTTTKQQTGEQSAKTVRKETVVAQSAANATQSNSNSYAGTITTVTGTDAPAKEVVRENPVASLRAAADRGDKDARYNLGMMYYNGDGVEKSYSTAFSYLKPLAEEGYTKAFFPVAEMYHGGRGITKDREAAEKWYTKAAKAGNAKAKRILMNM